MKPTKSSRLKERTLTDTKISLGRDKSNMSSNKAGSDAGGGIKSGNDDTANDVDGVNDVVQEALALEENDLDEYDPDLFITEEEKKAFDYMLEQKRAEIVERKETFQKWVDTITRRRMFALSRMRKINLSHGKRNKLYSKLEVFIKDVYNENETSAELSAQEDENGNVSKEYSTEARSDGPASSQMSREDTGFVSRDNEHTPNTLQNQTPVVAQLHS